MLFAWPVFLSRHVHHLPMEAHVSELVLQSHKVEARLKNPGPEAHPFPWTPPKTKCACCDSRIHLNCLYMVTQPFKYLVLRHNVLSLFLKGSTEVHKSRYLFWTNICWTSAWLQLVKQEMNHLQGPVCFISLSCFECKHTCQKSQKNNSCCLCMCSLLKPELSTMKHLSHRVCRHLLVKVSNIWVSVMLVNWNKLVSYQDINITYVWYFD